MDRMKLLAIFSLHLILIFPIQARAQTDVDTLSGYGIVPRSRRDAIDTLLTLRKADISPAFAGMNSPTMGAFVLARLCQDRSQDNACTSYLHAHQNEINSLARAGNWTDFCVPRNISNSSLRDIILRFISDDPRVKQLDLSPTDSFALAYLEIAKCAEEEPSAESRELHYRAYAQLIPGNLGVTCKDFLRHSPKADTVVQLIEAWSIVEDDDKTTRWKRESLHGVGAPVLPRLNMTPEQARQGAEQWCMAHPEQGITSGVQDGVYSSERLRKFGTETEDTPEEAAEKRRWAEDEEKDRRQYADQDAKATAAADKMGPRHSCLWKLQYARNMFGGRPAGDDSVSESWRDLWDWCTAHPNASTKELVRRFPGAAQQ